MTLRNLSKIVVLGLSAAAAVSSLPSASALAQGWGERPAWEDDPRFWRPRRFDRRYEGPAYDDSYMIERRLRRPGWRFQERGWTRVAPENWNGEQQPDTARPVRPRDGTATWDDADEEPARKAVGSDGGSRPVIEPRAPSIVAFAGGSTYKPGSIVIDTSARRLYYVRNAMSAFAYPIGVGREGFSWTGHEKVSRMADWPDWYPPAEMRQRKPELPERMLGGLRNPLGAKAIYLGNTLYRIHGTNDPKSIGKAESSGCFRMMNEHVLHLASIVTIGTEVTVVRSLQQRVPGVATVVKAKPRYTQSTTTPSPSPRVRWSADPDGYYADPDDYNWR